MISPEFLKENKGKQCRFYFTAYALNPKKGILEIEGEICCRVIHSFKGNSNHWYMNWRRGCCSTEVKLTTDAVWQTRQEAIANAKQRQIKEIEKLTKRLEKIQSVVFE